MGLGLGNQAGSPPLQGAVNQAIAEGGIVTDVTSNRQFDSEDITVVGQMLTGGNSGQSGGGEWSGAVRLAALRYDYRNQMVEYENLDFGGVTLYAYDCFGRRISKTLDANGSPTRTRCVNGGHMNWQVLQERSGTGSGPNAGAILADYVYGNYIDEPIQMSRDFDGDGVGNTQHFFYHQNDLFNVVALTAGVTGATVPGVTPSFPAGAVVERVRYGDYGSPEFINAAGTAMTFESIARNPYLFTGREWDDGIRFYYYRTRYMEPTWGRFTTRDSIGTWGDSSNQGNAYGLVAAHPLNSADPFGQSDEPGWTRVPGYLGKPKREKSVPPARYPLPTTPGLRIRYNPVIDGQYHAFLHLTCNDGREFYFRGGPKGGEGLPFGPTLPGLVPSESPYAPPRFDWGPIDTSHGPYLPNTPDWPPPADTVPYTDVPLPSDVDEAELIKKLCDGCGIIENSNTEYSPTGPNSNTTIRELLEHIGAPVPPVTPVSTPGFYNHDIPGIGVK